MVWMATYKRSERVNSYLTPILLHLSLCIYSKLTFWQDWHCLFTGFTWWKERHKGTVVVIVDILLLVSSHYAFTMDQLYIKGDNFSVFFSSLPKN